MASTDFLIALFILLLIALSNSFFWGRFSKDLEFFNNQRPGMCVDGRLMSEPMSAVTGLGIDDTKRNKNNVEMRCVFRVAFYACVGADSAFVGYDGSCDSPASQPSHRDRTAWPLREAGSAGVLCSSIGKSRCSSDEWDCNDIGKCDAYEKAVRLCISKLRQEPYPCYAVHDNVKAGVRVEPASFPAGWLVGGIFSVLLSAGCCVGFLRLIEPDENYVRKLLPSCLCFLCFVGATTGIGFAIIAILGSDKMLGTWETSLMELANSTGQVSGASPEATDLVAPFEAEETPYIMPWWVIALIVLGSMCGAFCLVMLWFALLGLARREGRNAREAALESAAAAQGDLKVGARVRLGSDSGQRRAGCGQSPARPGDVGVVVREDPTAIPEPFLQVNFNGFFAWYPRSSLEPAPDGAVTMQSNGSNSSLGSNTQPGMISRKELARTVSGSSHLSMGQLIGHAVLQRVESQQEFLRRASSKMDVLPKPPVPTVAVMEVPGFVPCPQGFKLQVGDSVLVDSNLEQVKKLCEDYGISWSDEKSGYLGREGSVKGTDWLGDGVRVLFPDGHWWSYHPVSLLIKVEKLSDERRAELESQTQV